MKNEPRPIIREIDGQLVLDDPAAYAVVRAVAKHNCKGTFDLNADRIEHFKARIAALGRTPQDTVITAINVDTKLGEAFASILMPGHDWNEIRARGEVPFARGLAQREGIEMILKKIDPEAHEKLTRSEGIVVLVVDFETVEVFPA